MKRKLKRAVRGGAAPVGAFLARLGLSADGVTLSGLVFALVAACGFYADSRLWALGGLIASGLADLLDGAVARAGGGPGTRFGAALDSTLDRYGEGVIFGGILIGALERGSPGWLVWTILLAGISSFLVSYVRARAEGLGIACEVGWLERPERLGLLVVLAIWGRGGQPYLIPLIAVLAHITFLQRLARIRGAE